MKKLASKWLRSFQPPLFLSCAGVIVFSFLSILSITAKDGKDIPPFLVYFIYAFAAITLTFAIWAIALFIKQASLKRILREAAHKTYFTSRLWDDFAYRTHTFVYPSLGINLLLTTSKAIVGWHFSSVWLFALAVYNLILCITKFIILRDRRKISRLTDETLCFRYEWKAYRICGFLFVLMTLTLEGIVILIVQGGNSFAYDGTLIFAVAIFDFYCLISSIINIIKTRKNHTPTIAAIKTISFAASLVSMFSLQTAMFASFGDSMAPENQQLMNVLTGSAVCVLLVGLGVIMIYESCSKLGSVNS